MTSTTVVMPFYGDGRLRVASWVSQRLRRLHPQWQLLIGTDDERPWSKTKAVNSAAERAFEFHDAQILVIHDADVVCSDTALFAAWAAVRDGDHPWAVPHGLVYRLNEHDTATVLAREPHVTQPDDEHRAYLREPYDGYPGGGLLVVSKAAWVDVGGFDERFIGWGSEDVSLGRALDTLTGPHWRGIAPLWHLWHEIEPRPFEMYANQRLEELYRLAAGDPVAMRELVSR